MAEQLPGRYEPVVSPALFTKAERREMVLMRAPPLRAYGDGSELKPKRQPEQEATTNLSLAMVHLTV
jgi:hypothetical protein